MLSNRNLDFYTFLFFVAIGTGCGSLTVLVVYRPLQLPSQVVFCGHSPVWSESNYMKNDSSSDGSGSKNCSFGYDTVINIINTVLLVVRLFIFSLHIIGLRWMPSKSACVDKLLDASLLPSSSIKALKHCSDDHAVLTIIS